MANKTKATPSNPRHKSSLSRRELFRNGGLLAAAGLASPGRSAAAKAVGKLRMGPDMYESIGVRPIINANGPITLFSGSVILPEVREAMSQASRRYVHIDELMEAVGSRLAEITGAEFGIVTSGCSAALVHATSACIAGGAPERIQRLPDLSGLKNEVVAPVGSRNVYDHAIRMLGVNIINVKNERELRAALGPRTALVMVLAKTADRAKTLRLEHIVPIAREQKIPVLVDAAAEDLSFPNVHLARGADLVAYSGGKAFRGPQSTGLLIGRKDLVQAAWLNSAPHHSFGRPMKVAKEDIMGLLAAVEMWVERDHEAERRTWAGWVDEIAASVGRVPGVETRVMRFEGIMQREPLIGIKWDSKPRLHISWDSEKLGITGDEVYKRLYSEEPRIVLRSASGDGRGSGESSVTVVPMYMQRGDANVVARRLYALLSDAAKSKRVAGGSSADVTGNAAANLVGRWDVRIDFAYGNADHKLFFEQDGANLTGTHLGERTEGAISGWVDGDRVVFRDTQQYEGGSFQYQFEGSITGDSMPDSMQGEVDLGEYGAARWSAKRHA